ncbi:hypothetical protein JCM8547_000148 [Rhodosporidiobolus lusitaniae]
MNHLRRIDKALSVEHELGVNGTTSTRWSNQDLNPVPENKRTWSSVDLASYWVSDQFSTATWDLGSTLVSLGLCARQAIPLSFVAFFVIGLVMSLNGRIGSTTHLSFPVVARSSFGMYGAYLPILARSILALLWLVILTYQGGRITVVMIGAIWPSFYNVKNTLPPDLGITTQEMIGFFVIWVFQAPLACVPVHKLKWFFLAKAWISAAGFFALFVWALVITKGKGFILTGYFDDSLLPYGSKSWAMISGLNAVTGLFSTVAINIPDFARFTRSTKAAWWQALIVPITGTIPVAIAICCAAAAEQHYGVQMYDPASLCGLFGSRAAQFFSAFAFWIATIGSNISANSISFATDITSIMPRYLTIFRCSVFAGLLCWATNPWRIVVDAPGFYAFLASYPVFLAPVATILFTDWYLVRRGKVDVRQLYNPKGCYAYFYGVNLRAVAAWICAMAPNLPGFAHAIIPSNPDVQPWTYMFAWYFSTITAFFWYLLFSWAFPPRSSFVDAAVYEMSEVGTDSNMQAGSIEKTYEQDKDCRSGVVAV